MSDGSDPSTELREALSELRDAILEALGIPRLVAWLMRRLED